MKKLLFTTLFFALLLTGCEKDEPESSKNLFTIDGKSYTLSGGIVINLMDYYKNGTGVFYVKLHTPNITLSETNDYSGKGNMLTLILISPTMQGLYEGEYTFQTSRSAYSFLFGVALMNYDASTENSDDYKTDSSSTGKVNVEMDLNFYKIDFEFTTTDNKKVKGHYEGLLKYTFAK